MIAPVFGQIQKWKLRWQRHGLFGSLKQAYLVVCQFFKFKGSPSYIIERLRVRREGREFDRRYGTDTGGKVHAANLGITGPNILFADGYLATAPRSFIDTIGRLPIIHRDFVFIDYGSGKGRALLMAAEFPFKKIIGIEISQILHEIAQQNIERLSSQPKQCKNIISLNLDVETFVPPQDPLLCYFYNPFRAKVMENVLGTLKNSIDHNSRDIWIMYNNALHAHLLDTATWLAPFDSIDCFRIWRSVVAVKQ